MNPSFPVFICDAREEFRSLLREMLSKHGFFHILEAASSSETLHLLSSDEKIHFIIVQKEILNEDILNSLVAQKNYLIMAQSDHSENFDLIAKLGVKHFLNFPFSSTDLLTRMEKVLQ